MAALRERALQLRASGDAEAVQAADDALADVTMYAYGLRLRADGGDLAQLTADTLRALQLRNEPARLLRFGGALVRVEHDDEGASLFRTLGVAEVRHEIARCAHWVKPVKGKLQDARPPKEVAEDVLATPDLPFPVVRRIVGVPVLSPNGDLADEPGYQAATRTFYEPHADLFLPTVSDDPAPDQIEDARELIVEGLLGDFLFVRDPDRAHAVALLLLPFLRELIPGPTPLHLIEKPTPGTGATLLVQALALPALGRVLPPMSEAHNEDDWRKKTFAKALQSPPYIFIDNLRRPLDRPPSRRL